MEGGEDVGRFWQVKRIYRRVGPSFEHSIRSVVSYHELSHTIVAALHELAASMECRKQDFIADLVGYLRSTMFVRLKSLLQFREEQIILGLHDIGLDLFDIRDETEEAFEYFMYVGYLSRYTQSG